MEPKLTVTICSGTTCYVMGGSELLLLEESIPPHLREKVSIEGSPCLGLCKDRRYGAAPYAKIGGEILPLATIPLILERITALVG